MHTSNRFLRCSFLISMFVVAMLGAAPTYLAAQETTTDALPDTATESVPIEGVDGEPQQMDPKEAIQLGEQLLQQGDYEKAMQLYTQMARAFSRQMEAQQFLWIPYTGRGRALAGLKQYQAAEREFKNAEDSGGTEVPAVYIARGSMYLDLGAPDQALTDFERATELDFTSVPALFGLGKAYVQLGGYQQAIGPLTQVIAAQPENAEAYRLRGSAYAGVFQTDKGLEDLQKAISLAPDDFEAYFMLGVVNLREEKFPEAIDSFTKAIEFYKPKPGEEDQPYLQGYLTRASAYVEQGNTATDEAAKREAYEKSMADCEYLLDELDERSPLTQAARAAALFSRGIAERMLGEYGQAIRTFSEAINLNPEMGEAYFRRGICYHNIDETKMAIADFAQAANITYDDPRANLWEGFMHAKLGDYHKAVRAYNDALAASNRYEPAYFNRGLTYMMLGEYHKAIDDFNESIRLNPTNADYFLKRGIAYEQIGDYANASESYSSAIEFDDTNVAAYRKMGETMRRLGRSELAEEYGKKADELAPRVDATRVE